MLSRREFLQVAAATAAICPARLDARVRAAAADRKPSCSAFDAARQRHAAARHRRARATGAGAFPRAVGQSRRRRGAGACRRTSPARTSSRASAFAEKSAAAYALTAEDFAALAQSYGRIGGLDRLATVVKAVRAERGDDGCCCSTAATPGRARSARTAPGARTWSTASSCLKPDAMTGHWEFTYGESAGEGAGRLASASRSSRSTCATPNGRSRCSTPYRMFEKGGVKVAVLGQAFRLYAGRQSALDDPDMDVRHPRGRRARQRREGAARGRAAGRAALAQRLRRRPQARGARRRHRRDPDRRTPTTRCPRRCGSARRC